MKRIVSKLIINILILSFALICFIPFYLVVIGSLTSEEYIRINGYGLFPNQIDFTAYRIVFINYKSILRGYGISFFVLIFGTPLSLMVTAMIAYPISQKRVKYRNILSFISYFTILFNGGMVPWYIVCVNILHLRNNLLGLILPYVVNAIYVMFVVNYFRSIPDQMHEAAYIDGAGEFKIFYKIIMPLSKPVLATVGLFIALNYWNDWWLGIMLIDKNEMQPLQLLLRTIVSNADFLKNQSGSSAAATKLTSSLPSEGIKMATCVITIGPIIFLYPYVQKYFIKGIMIGAVKG